MNEKTILVKGPWAIIVLLLLGMYIVFGYYDRNRTLETGAIEVIKTWLVAEYSMMLLPELQAMVQEPSGKEEQIGEIAAQISRENIAIRNVEARGSGEDVAVRFEVTVNGRDPPDAKRIRYFRMSHSPLIGWQYEYEIDKWRYYLSF